MILPGSCTEISWLLLLLLHVLACRRGGDLLLKLINPDAAKPAADLEQPELLQALMKLLLGDQVGALTRLHHASRCMYERAVSW